MEGRALAIVAARPVRITQSTRPMETEAMDRKNI